MKKLVRVGKIGFGVFGGFTALYWGLLNAKFGLIGKVLGQNKLDWVNSKMSLFNDILPYIVVFASSTFLVLWFVDWLRGTIKKRRQKNIESKETIIAGIKESLNKAIESLDKLNNQK
jgi:hypothetical protein